MSSKCKHYSITELQSDKDFRELSEWTRSVEPRYIIADELERAKVLNLVGDWQGGPGQVKARPIERHEHVVVAEVKSSGLWMRSATQKVERAAMFQVSRSRSTRSNKCDEVALAAVLAELAGVE